MVTAKWPKVLPPLTPEQQNINDRFMQQWHEELGARKRYGLIERFNHQFPVRPENCADPLAVHRTTETDPRIDRAAVERHLR